MGNLLKDLSADQFFEMLDGLQRGEAAMTRQTTTRLMKGLAERLPHCFALCKDVPRPSG